MRNGRLGELQAGIKIGGRNINNLRYVDDTTLMADSEEELKSLLMKVKEENERTSLKLNIKKTKIMASGPITAWQMEAGGGSGWRTTAASQRNSFQSCKDSKFLNTNSLLSLHWKNAFKPHTLVT